MNTCHQDHEGTHDNDASLQSFFLLSVKTAIKIKSIEILSGMSGSATKFLNTQLNNQEFIR